MRETGIVWKKLNVLLGIASCFLFLLAASGPILGLMLNHEMFSQFVCQMITLGVLILTMWMSLADSNAECAEGLFFNPLYLCAVDLAILFQFDGKWYFVIALIGCVFCCLRQWRAGIGIVFGFGFVLLGTLEIYSLILMNWGTGMGSDWLSAGNMLRAPWVELLLLVCSIAFLAVRKSVQIPKFIYRNPTSEELEGIVSGILFCMIIGRLDYADGMLSWEQRYQPIYEWSRQLGVIGMQHLYVTGILLSAGIGALQIRLGRRILDLSRIRLSVGYKLICALLAATLPSALFLDQTLLYGAWLQTLFLLLVVEVLTFFHTKKIWNGAVSIGLLLFLAGYLWYCDYVYAIAFCLLPALFLLGIGLLLEKLHRNAWVQNYHPEYALFAILFLFSWMHCATFLEEEQATYQEKRSYYHLAEALQGNSIATYAKSERLQYVLETRQMQLRVLEDGDLSADFLVTEDRQDTYALWAKKPDIYLLCNMGKESSILACGEDIAVRNDCEMRLVQPISFEMLHLSTPTESYDRTRRGKYYLSVNIVDEIAGAGINIYPFYMSYHTYSPDGTLLNYDHARTELSPVVSAMDTYSLEVSPVDFVSSDGKGYVLVDILWEGNSWMSWEHFDNTLAFWYEDGKMELVEDMDSLPFRGI